MTDINSRPAAGRAAGLGVLVAACVSALVVNANTSAVTILLPAISADTGAPLDQLQWAVTGYMLVGAAVIVTSGALGDVLGRRRVFLAGLVLFVASCVLIALAGSGGGVIAGRMIQGAAGSTILACGMSLLSAASSGAAQMRAITLWGAASAAGAAAGPLVGGLLVDATGWQGLFWIDAAIAAALIPVTMSRVSESRDPNRSRSIDMAGTVLIAVVLVPLVLALSEGNTWGWASPATLGCLLVSVLAAVAFVAVEQRVAAPIVDLRLLRNVVLVGATLAILLVAGAINALMYLLSLYFQDPAAFGMSALEAGLATLPAAAAMIAVTPLITPFAVKIGPGLAVAIGFALAAVGFAALGFVTASWSYAAFVLPLVAVAIGLGLANGPASAASTAVVSTDEVGQASGISNMARYIGGSLAVAAAATVSTAVTDAHRAAGDPAGVALAAGLSRAALLMTVMSAAGIVLALMVRHHRATQARAVDRAAAAAATTHTIPTEPR
ncbi:MFS transporter [Amorphoplanes digitatis]|uniref:EmrB/QacA subfamily drug resistance transporter n=1 Tax=Actinoplanes digitatis TaxID=1868 RepID=A0A7W7I0G1_9ACTN|nr:MFS transporter [Actinoplanes digitatis]MBB4764143.1 EmrB/QacA subfamily drug resistance transporter [Actinoplanes digitatis]GID97532.1 MFS transporter [Actinoplanes digitatis]